MLRRLSSGLDTGREEARQLLRKASNRFSGLLSGYRSLSVHSDDFDRHEYGASLSICVLLTHGLPHLMPPVYLSTYAYLQPSEDPMTLSLPVQFASWLMGHMQCVQCC